MGAGQPAPIFTCMNQEEAGQALLEEADRLNASGQLAEAEKLYDQLLSQNHDQAWLIATLGTLYLRMQKYGLAITLLHRAVETLSTSEVFCNLGLAYKYSGQHQKALKWFNRSIERNPTAETLATYSGLHVNVGTPEKALEVADRAIKKDPRHALAHWNKALALLELGRWDCAWDEMEFGFETKMRIDRKLGGKPRWDGSPGKTIAIYGEQGLGDEIMFASILPDVLKENQVILESHSRLQHIFEHSFPGVRVFGTREDHNTTWPSSHPFDAQISIGSLGQFYRRKSEDFPGTPYLKADQVSRGDRFRVGISWTGGKKQGRILTRSVPLSWWGSILNNDCEFVSLQYTDVTDEIATVNRVGGYNIREDPAVQAHDYMETARLVASCDLVISVCTSVIHLAGALGVPCWVMVPNKPAWRYGVRGKNPWYRSVRHYRQPLGDVDAWRAVVERIGCDLNELLDSKERKVA